MTRYDDVQMDPSTGLTTHPLAGIPQEVLDAATQALTEATEEQIIGADDQRERVFDSDQVEPVAHAVLLAALEAAQTALSLFGGPETPGSPQEDASASPSPEIGHHRAEAIRRLGFDVVADPTMEPGTFRIESGEQPGPRACPRCGTTWSAGISDFGRWWTWVCDHCEHAFASIPRDQTTEAGAWLDPSVPLTKRMDLFDAEMGRQVAERQSTHLAYGPSITDDKPTKRDSVEAAASDPSHPDHDEAVGADNSRCRASICALHGKEHVFDARGWQPNTTEGDKP